MNDELLQWTTEQPGLEPSTASAPGSSPPASIASPPASIASPPASTASPPASTLSVQRATRDVWTERLPDLDWSQPRAALETIHAFLVQHAEVNIGWYLRRKAEKRRWATGLRFSAIVMGALAAIIPAVVGIFPKDMFAWNWAPLASVFAALGAGCLALDKFFGFSSGWMRFMWTETELQSRLRTFLLTWERERLRLRHGPLTHERTEALLKFMRAFALEVDTLVRMETRAWVEEFKGGLASTEKTTETPAASGPLLPAGAMWGTLRLQLEGADRLDGRRWQVQLGADPPMDYRGSTLVADDLRPGRLIVRVSALRDGEPVMAEDVVDIRAGERADLVIRLE